MLTSLCFKQDQSISRMNKERTSYASENEYPLDQRAHV